MSHRVMLSNHHRDH